MTNQKSGHPVMINDDKYQFEYGKVNQGNSIRTSNVLIRKLEIYRTSLRKLSLLIAVSIAMLSIWLICVISFTFDSCNSMKLFH